MFAEATPTPAPLLALLPPPAIEREQACLLRLIRRLCYDDALTWRGYRLEYLYLSAGFVHYRLYWRGRVVHRQDIRSKRVLDGAQAALARELALRGWQADEAQHIEFGALTALGQVRVRRLAATACAVRCAWWTGRARRTAALVQMVLL